MPSDKMGADGYSVRPHGGGEIADDDDVEGHGKSLVRASDEDDVEGHGKSLVRASDEDDVEGHGTRGGAKPS